jgi:hypothetical protein
MNVLWLDELEPGVERHMVKTMPLISLHAIWEDEVEAVACIAFPTCWH